MSSIRFTIGKDSYFLTLNNVYKNGVKKPIGHSKNWSSTARSVIKKNDVERAKLFIKRLHKYSSFPDKNSRCIICGTHLRLNKFVCHDHNKSFNRYYFEGKKVRPIISVKY